MGVIITYIPKADWLCGGRAAGVKSLHDPKVASTVWCGTGTRCKWTCAAHQPRYSCSISSTPELNSARIKHASSCASISITAQWGAAQNAQVTVTCEPVSSAGPVLRSTQAPQQQLWGNTWGHADPIYIKFIFIFLLIGIRLRAPPFLQWPCWEHRPRSAMLVQHLWSARSVSN